MEKQITHLCGGYYRSFKQFKIHVEMMDNNMTFLQECARFLLETHEEKNELKQRFTNLFFETYGQQIAGDCGCSHLVFDHQLIPVRQPEFLIDLMHATLDLGVIDCSSDHLGRNLNAVFKTKFSLSTFQRKLRANTLREGILYKKIKSYKDK